MVPRNALITAIQREKCAPAAAAAVVGAFFHAGAAPPLLPDSLLLFILVLCRSLDSYARRRPLPARYMRFCGGWIPPRCCSLLFFASPRAGCARTRRHGTCEEGAESCHPRGCVSGRCEIRAVSLRGVRLLPGAQKMSSAVYNHLLGANNAMLCCCRPERLPRVLPAAHSSPHRNNPLPIPPLPLNTHTYTRTPFLLCSRSSDDRSPGYVLRLPYLCRTFSRCLSP